jgi:hypothetical protein
MYGYSPEQAVRARYSKAILMMVTVSEGTKIYEQPSTKSRTKKAKLEHNHSNHQPNDVRLLSFSSFNHQNKSLTHSNHSRTLPNI